MAEHPEPPAPPENPPISADVSRAIRGEPPSGVHVPHPEIHPILAPGHDFASVTEKISSIVLGRGTPLWWFAGFGLSFALMNVRWTPVLPRPMASGGGENHPLGWAFDILTFVWWIASATRHPDLPPPPVRHGAHVDQPVRGGMTLFAWPAPDTTRPAPACRGDY